MEIERDGETIATRAMTWWLPFSRSGCAALADRSRFRVRRSRDVRIVDALSEPRSSSCFPGGCLRSEEQRDGYGWPSHQRTLAGSAADLADCASPLPRRRISSPARCAVRRLKLPAWKASSGSASSGSRTPLHHCPRRSPSRCPRRSPSRCPFPAHSIDPPVLGGTGAAETERLGLPAGAVTHARTAGRIGFGDNRGTLDHITAGPVSPRQASDNEFELSRRRSLGWGSFQVRLP